MLSTIQLARAQARDRASTARGELTGTELPGSRAADQTIAEVVIDLDATLVTAHSPGFGTRSLRVKPLAPGQMASFGVSRSSRQPTAP
jgi:hypothetical protein